MWNPGCPAYDFYEKPKFFKSPGIRRLPDAARGLLDFCANLPFIWLWVKKRMWFYIRSKLRLHSTSSFICFLSEVNRKVVCLTWNSCSLTKFLSLVLFTRWDVFLYLVCILGWLFLFLWSFFKLLLKVSETFHARILVALACRWHRMIRCCTQRLKTKQNTGTQDTIFWEQGFKMQLLINFCYWLLQ